MDVQVEETGPVERRLRVEIPIAEVDAAFDTVYRQLGKTARIRGFRAGRTPRAVLQRLLGARARADVLERILQDSLPKAILEAKLPVLGEPRLRPDAEPKEGAPFVYEVTVEIRPEIELRKVRQLELAPAPLPVPDTDPVESYLEELRGSQAQEIEESEGIQAARGHVAVVEYEGTCEGRPFEGSSGKEVLVELGGGRAIPGFEEQIEGMTVATDREFDVDLPKQFPVRDVAGKTAHFRVRLVGLKRRELPDLDDEFAKDVSELDTLEGLRESLRSKLEEGRERDRMRLLREAAGEKLVEENPFPVPEGLVDRQLQSSLARAAAQVGRGLKEDRLRELIEGWRKEWRPRAEQDVRLALLVPEVAEVEGIEVQDSDLSERLRVIADERGVPLKDLRREFKQRGLLDGVRAALLEERVLEFLVREATVSDS